jgi:hypothetical protein
MRWATDYDFIILCVRMGSAASRSSYPQSFLQEWDDRKWRQGHDLMEALYVKIDLSHVGDRRIHDKGQNMGILLTSFGNLSIILNDKATKRVPTPLRIVEWKPTTTMRNCEIVNYDTPKSFCIPRGDGIGVVIVDAYDAYVKLYWSDDGRIEPIYTRWPVNTDAKACLDHDVGMVTVSCTWPEPMPTSGSIFERSDQPTISLTLDKIPRSRVKKMQMAKMVMVKS